MYYVGSIPAVESDVVHYGRLGMKWGEHIFTEKNKGFIGSSNKLSKVKSEPQKRDEGAFSYKTKKVVDSARTTIDNTRQTVDKFSNRKPSKKVRDEVRNMSDNELRQKINRMQMEEQYYRMSDSTKNRGVQKVSDILAVAGSVVGIASGVISTVVAIKQLSSGDPAPKTLKLKR